MAKPLGFGGRDYPDFGVSTVSLGLTAQLDIAELAARLGSPVTYNRQGNVLFVDSFAYGRVNWEVVGYPSGAFPTLNARYTRTGPYSMRLRTTSDSGSYSGIQTGFRYPYLATMGIELHFKAIAAFETFWLNFDIFDGTNEYDVQIKLNEKDNTLQYSNSVGSFVTLDDLDINRGSSAPYNAFKLTLDLPNQYYMKLLLNEREYNLSRKSVKVVSSTTKAYLYVYLLLWPEDSTVETLYVDDVIVTINEPI